MFALLIQSTAVEELHVWIGSRQLQNMRVEVAKGGGKQNVRFVLLNHVSHYFLDFHRFRHTRLIDRGDSSNIFQPFLAQKVRLVIAIVVLGSNVDETQGEFFAGGGYSAFWGRTGDGSWGGSAASPESGSGSKSACSQQAPDNLPPGWVMKTSIQQFLLTRCMKRLMEKIRDRPALTQPNLLNRLMQYIDMSD